MKLIDNNKLNADLEDLLSAFRSIHWFNAWGEASPRVEAVDRVRDHLATFGPMSPAIVEVEFLEGGFSLLHQDRWGEDPYDAWGSAWTASQWTLAKQDTNLRCQIEGIPEAVARLRPPLWPIAGKSGIVGNAEIPQMENLPKTLTKGWSPQDMTVAWALLCAADSVLRDALLVKVVADLIPRPNPWIPLIELHELGFFPMGWVGSRYTVFRYEPNRDDQFILRL